MDGHHSYRQLLSEKAGLSGHTLRYFQSRASDFQASGIGGAAGY